MKFKKTALITGITGQDGSILADYLLKKGYKIIGIKRRSSSFNTERIDHLYNNKILNKSYFPFYGDLTDSTNLIRIIQQTKPNEIYNLAAQSHVRTSFETPEYTANADALGTLRLLEAIRILKMEKSKILSSLNIRDIWKHKDTTNEKLIFSIVLTLFQSIFILDSSKLQKSL